MNSKLIAILIAIILMIPSGSGLFIASNIALPVRKIKIEKQLAKEISTQAAIDAEKEAQRAEEEAYNKLHTFLGLTKDEIVGYGTFQTPISHYKLNKALTVDTKRIYEYYNSIASVEFYYVEDLTDNDKDNPAKNILGFTDEPEIEKVENEKFEVLHLISEGDYNGFYREAYIVYKDKSALIIDAYLLEETDKEAFRESINIILPTINIYYVADLVFDVPDSGYWGTVTTEEENDSSQNESVNSEEQTDGEVNKSDKKSNTKNKKKKNNKKNKNAGTEYSNYVGGNTEGTVRTNLVSDDWKDLRIVLDGLVIDMQDPLDRLIEDGYKFENSNIENETVAAGKQIRTYMYKDNGVAIEVTALNNTESSLKPGNLIITGVVVDIEKFGHYTNNSEYNSDNLPELILANGMTWDITYDTLRSLGPEEFWVDQRSDGTTVITYDEQVEYMQLIADNASGLKEVTLKYDYKLANQQEIAQEQQEAEAES